MAIVHKCILTWPSDQTHLNSVILEDKTAKKQSKAKAIGSPACILAPSMSQSKNTYPALVGAQHCVEHFPEFYYNPQGGSMGETLLLFSLNR